MTDVKPLEQSLKDEMLCGGIDAKTGEPYHSSPDYNAVAPYKLHCYDSRGKNCKYCITTEPKLYCSFLKL